MNHAFNFTTLNFPDRIDSDVWCRYNTHIRSKLVNLSYYIGVFYNKEDIERLIDNGIGLNTFILWELRAWDYRFKTFVNRIRLSIRHRSDLGMCHYSIHTHPYKNGFWLKENKHTYWYLGKTRICTKTLFDLLNHFDLNEYSKRYHSFRQMSIRHNSTYYILNNHAHMRRIYPYNRNTRVWKLSQLSSFIVDTFFNNHLNYLYNKLPLKMYKELILYQTYLDELIDKRYRNPNSFLCIFPLPFTALSNAKYTVNYNYKQYFIQ